MRQQHNMRFFITVLLVINCILLIAWIFDKGETQVYAQDTAISPGRYQFEYIPARDGYDPRYIVFDTATGSFWEAKGFIENIDDFVVYDKSDLQTGIIGGSQLMIHKHE
jgi:hypothetical protein